MRLIKIILAFALLSLLSLCPFLPRQLQEPTEISSTETSPSIMKPITGTSILETPTATITEGPHPPTRTTTPEIQTSHTNEPLIRDNLQDITLENIGNLTLIAEIPFPQIEPDHLIYALDFSDDGTKLAIKSQSWKNRQNALIVWDLVSNSQLLKITEDNSLLLGQIYFSPDNDQLWGFRDGFFDQYDLLDGKLVNSIVIPEFTGSAIAISPDRKTIVTGIVDNSTQNSVVNFYEFGSLDPYYSEAIAYMIMSFRFSPDSRMVAGTSAQIGSSVTKIWDVETGTMLKDFYNYDYGPTFSSDSSLAAFAKGKQFSIFATNSWILTKTFQNDNPASTNFPIFFLGNDQILAIQETASLTFNDVNTGEELLELPVQATVVGYSPALNMIITNTNLENIKIWGILQ